MAHDWFGLLSCRGCTVLPSHIDGCFCISTPQRTSGLGSYRCESWPGLPWLQSGRYARTVSIVP